jgi:hypothetical protein
MDDLFGGWGINFGYFTRLDDWAGSPHHMITHQ